MKKQLILIYAIAAIALSSNTRAGQFDGFYLTHGFNETLNHIKYSRSIANEPESKGENYNANKLSNYFGAGYGTLITKTQVIPAYCGVLQKS